MSNWSYVFSCMFKNDDCDEFGMDCWCCPYYDEDEDDKDEDDEY